TIEYSNHCTFFPGKVLVKAVQSGDHIDRTIPLPGKVYLIDNNNLSLFAFLITFMPREEGKVITFKAFHPTTLQVISAQLKVKGRESITIKNKKYDCWALDISLAGYPLNVWVDDKGRLIKDIEFNNSLTIELVEE
ncbi:MAG: DUF3108 domain-containing protein, partial [bacterium]|nr:DUF3108 domain-containing protein [bacterium]